MLPIILTVLIPDITHNILLKIQNKITVKLNAAELSWMHTSSLEEKPEGGKTASTHCNKQPCWAIQVIHPALLKRKNSINNHVTLCFIFILIIKIYCKHKKTRQFWSVVSSYGNTTICNLAKTAQIPGRASMGLYKCYYGMKLTLTHKIIPTKFHKLTECG